MIGNIHHHKTPKSNNTTNNSSKKKIIQTQRLEFMQKGPSISEWNHDHFACKEDDRIKLGCQLFGNSKGLLYRNPCMPFCSSAMFIYGSSIQNCLPILMKNETRWICSKENFPYHHLQRGGIWAILCFWKTQPITIMITILPYKIILLNT